MVDRARAADAHHAAHRELLGVGEQHDAVGRLDHRALDRHLHDRGVPHGQLLVDAARAQEEDVGADLAQRVLGEHADERAIVAPHDAAGEHELDPVVGQQLLEHGEARRDHAKAPAVQVVRGLQRGRADVDHHRLAVGDQRRGGRADPVLGGEALDRRLLERRLRAGEQRAAVHALQLAGAGELAEVAADGHLRHAELLREVADVARAGADGAQHRLAPLGGERVPRLTYHGGQRASRRSSACTSSSGVSNEISAEPPRREPLVPARVERDRHAAWPRAQSSETSRTTRPLMSGDHGGVVPSVSGARRHAVVRRRVGGRRAARHPDRDVALLARPQEDPRAPGPARAQVDLAESRSRSTSTSVIALSRGAGSRPEIGTPSRADWAIVCGESAPLRFGLETFGSGGFVGRSAGGV